MSRQAKGAENERQAKRIWADVFGERWVFGAQMTGWSTEDIFDLFDFQAWTGDSLHLVQVRSNGATGIEAFAEGCQPFRVTPGFAPLMVTKYDGEGWRLVGVDGDGEGHFTMYDERDDPDVAGHRGTELNLGEGLTRYLREEVADG